MTSYRALIEAAEAMLAKLEQIEPSVNAMIGVQFARTGWQYDGPNYAQEKDALKAAISSAKAAEEGVETKYQVTRLEYRGNLAQTIDLTEKESAKVFDSWSTNMAAYHDQAVSLLRKDTYTTVISVREKEGLHGQ